MDKLQLHTHDKTNSNIEKIAHLFPHCVTECINEKTNEVEKAIDFDKLKQELSASLLGEKQERYQFTWPDKQKTIWKANRPINKTLRPCYEESKNFDTTQNLYIEGDNLAVLKILQETYLNKIKVIYIDPPYNTDSDFIFKDSFHVDENEYLENSGQFDEEGNRYFQNTESNGRFHTDWLNMMFPRLKIARDLLSEEGVIFISIDEHEIDNLLKICTEIFGEKNNLHAIVWDKRNPKGGVSGLAQQHEYIIACCKDKVAFKQADYFYKEKDHAESMLDKIQNLLNKANGKMSDAVQDEYQDWLKSKENEFTNGELAYKYVDSKGDIYQTVSMAAPDKPETRSHRPLIHPVTGKECPVPAKGWRYTNETMDELLHKGKIVFGDSEKTQPRNKYLLKENIQEQIPSVLYFGGTGSQDCFDLAFNNPKPLYLLNKLIQTLGKNDIILDFFSGSATTAHAVMQLNAEDNGNRKFICVQLPEECNEKSEAFKAGYKNICEIGKERIRRAGEKIKEEMLAKNNGNVATESEANKSLANEAKTTLFASEDFAAKPKIFPNLDIGFRVLKVDSPNMNDVYKRAQLTAPKDLFDTINNIDITRSQEDLLFQTMLQLGIMLSASIEEEIVLGKKLFKVNDDYLLASFEDDLSEDFIKEVAMKKPYYFVMKDKSRNSDSFAINAEQLFKVYSPDTIRKVL